MDSEKQTLEHYDNPTPSQLTTKILDRVRAYLETGSILTNVMYEQKLIRKNINSKSMHYAKSKKSGRCNAIRVTEHTVIVDIDRYKNIVSINEMLLEKEIKDTESQPSGDTQKTDNDRQDQHATEANSVSTKLEFERST